MAGLMSRFHLPPPPPKKLTNKSPEEIEKFIAVCGRLVPSFLRVCLDFRKLGGKKVKRKKNEKEKKLGRNSFSFSCLD